jgi:hypothetical protein
VAWSGAGLSARVGSRRPSADPGDVGRRGDTRLVELREGVSEELGRSFVVARGRETEISRSAVELRRSAGARSATVAESPVLGFEQPGRDQPIEVNAASSRLMASVAAASLPPTGSGLAATSS